MMRSTFVLLLGILFTATGCTRYYYKPNAVNVPLLTGKNQLHADVVGLRNSDGNGSGQVTIFDAQAAYSPLNHLGVIASFSSWNYEAFNPSPNIGHIGGKAYLAELGVGGYLVLLKRKSSSVVTDFYFGGGKGAMQSDINMNASRFFIQPGIGLKSRFVDVGINLRMSRLAFSDFDSNGYNIFYMQQWHLYDAGEKRYIYDEAYTFLEPALTIRAGYKFLKLQFQFVYAKDLNGLEWKYNPVRCTAGLHFSLEDLLSTLHRK